MGQTADLIKALKNVLKSRQITYKQLAATLGVSEVTIKRGFSGMNFTLGRLEEICRAIDVDIYDLVMRAKKEQQTSKHTLTLEQEHHLAEDTELFAFFLLILNGWSLSAIEETYRLTTGRITEMLLKLDRLKLLILYPENRFQLCVENNIMWVMNSPLWKRYQNEFLEDCIGYLFHSRSDRITFAPALLSEASIATLIKRLDALNTEFHDLARLDATIPHEHRRSVALFFAFRPWVVSSIVRMLRTDYP